MEEILFEAIETQEMDSSHSGEFSKDILDRLGLDFEITHCDDGTFTATIFEIELHEIDTLREIENKYLASQTTMNFTKEV